MCIEAVNRIRHQGATLISSAAQKSSDCAHYVAAVAKDLFAAAHFTFKLLTTEDRDKRMQMLREHCQSPQKKE
jgi:hypothetical protein